MCVTSTNWNECISKILTITYSPVYRISKKYQRDPIKFSDMFSSKILDLNIHSEIKMKLIEYINNKNTSFITDDIKHFESHEIGSQSEGKRYIGANEKQAQSLI